MKIWLDTIDFEVVAEGAKTGIISGITTNPSILSNTQNVPDTLRRLLDIQPGPIAVQVTSHTVENMIEEAQAIFEFSHRMVVKIPVNHNGLLAIEHLKKSGIPILGTGILFATQALLAINHNVAYIAPYFHHIKDVGDPFETLKTIANLAKTTDSSTKILVASLKHLEDIIYCALLGVEAITIKPQLYHQLVANHAIVENFSQKFFSDWMQTHGQVSIKEVLELGV
jgi:TalC/MipB family fructose-6-phosphate aldolase